jgi:putative endonuclease
MREHHYWVYMLASHSHRLYIGVTNDLKRRLIEHKTKESDGFTAQYNIDKLVFYEYYQDIRLAIAREKQLKGWRREKKIVLIEEYNPVWEDLSWKFGVKL